MGRRFASVLIPLLPALMLAGCVGPSAQTTTYTSYGLTCCTAGDVDMLWRPGSTVDLHLIPMSSQVTTVNPTHHVRITGLLSGPFADVATLKQGREGADKVTGSPVVFDDREVPSSDSVITFLLPANLPSGLYNLDVNTDFGDGGSAGGASIVRVGI